MLFFTKLDYQIPRFEPWGFIGCAFEFESFSSFCSFFNVNVDYFFCPAKFFYRDTPYIYF